MKYKPFIIALISASSATTWAADQHRHHDAHVHGHAALTLAVSANAVQLELESPAMNLVGFEHRPGSDSDRQRVRDVTNFLEQPSRWVQMPGDAGCHLRNARVNSSLLEDTHHHHHDHSSHAQEAHADFSVSIDYHCTHTDALRQLDLSGLFQRFAGFERIDVQWLTDRQQSASELDRHNTVIELH